MNLERLRAVQAAEREADSLRPLPDEFYRDVADYLAELREERRRAAESAEDPFGSEEVRRLTDEIETAEEVVEAVYERRVGKLVKRASLAASGIGADEEGLTAEEADLFEDLVDLIETHRTAVMADLEGGSNDVEAGSAGADAGTSAAGDPSAPPDDPDPEPGPNADVAVGRSETTEGAVASPTEDDAAAPPEDPPSSDAENAPTDGEDASTDGGPAADVDRVTLRITRDVGEVFGVDERTYDLAAEDVVTLPAANAKPLIERDAAEEIN